MGVWVCVCVGVCVGVCGYVCVWVCVGVCGYVVCLVMFIQVEHTNVSVSLKNQYSLVSLENCSEHVKF